MRIDGSNYIVHEETLLKRFCDFTKIYRHHFLNCSSEEVIFHARIPQLCTPSWPDPIRRQWICWSVITIFFLSGISTFSVKCNNLVVHWLFNRTNGKNCWIVLIFSIPVSNFNKAAISYVVIWFFPPFFFLFFANYKRVN